MADRMFEVPKLAQLYDLFQDPQRPDLDAYMKIAAEFEARSVLDIGCGTGTFAVLLASRGLDVVAIDPAAASLEIARSKPGADRVRWIHGEASGIQGLQVDLATMTGNVAQVFLTDEDWFLTLTAARSALRPGGHLAFETRDPKREAWQRWTPQASYRQAEFDGIGTVEAWTDLTAVDGSLVSFRYTVVFPSDGQVLTSDTTLRFRTSAEVVDSLRSADLVLDEVRDAPDRPGLEYVFIAHRPYSSP